MVSRWRFLCVNGAVLAALAGCGGSFPLVPPALPDSESDVVNETAGPSAESVELAAFYQRVESSLQSRGLLRTDEGTLDAPFDADVLTQNFERVALFEEYSAVAGRLVAREAASFVHRWEDPVRLEVNFGASLEPAQEARDRDAIASYAGRLGRVTGHPVRQVSADGNFHVFVVNEDERRALAPDLLRVMPDLDQATLDAVINLPRSSYCLVIARDQASDGIYDTAVTVIRAEHPDLLRLSCLHEELAQGMGLANDSPSARPSVFNDDEEFALLTRHDEFLLAILYDRRLQPGMNAAQAMPIVAEIARELLPEDDGEPES